MIFNECNDYTNQNLFPPNELERTRILYGPANEERRLQLYKFMTHNIYILNKSQLLMLFKNIVSLNVKLSKNEITKNENGVQALKDILNIFVIMCKKEQENTKQIKSSGVVNHNEAFDENMIIPTSVDDRE